MTQIAIIGGGLAGKLAALYFVRHLPEASITMIDPGDPNLPVVGESTVRNLRAAVALPGRGTNRQPPQPTQYPMLTE